MLLYTTCVIADDHWTVGLEIFNVSLFLLVLQRIKRTSMSARKVTCIATSLREAQLITEAINRGRRAYIKLDKFHKLYKKFSATCRGSHLLPWKMGDIPSPVGKYRRYRCLQTAERVSAAKQTERGSLFVSWDNLIKQTGVVSDSSFTLQQKVLFYLILHLIVMTLDLIGFQLYLNKGMWCQQCIQKYWQYLLPTEIEIPIIEVENYD